MPNYRRYWRPGGTWFFTVALADRRSDLLVRQIDLLREAVAEVRDRHPFRIDAAVVLPDHLHMIWTLPEGDTAFDRRWRLIKGQFSKGIPRRPVSRYLRQGEREVWQRRYWEHMIRDERDWHAHVDYMHYNPVKHGLVSRVRDWPYSSFHDFVRRGILSPDWGGDVSQFSTRTPHQQEETTP